MPKTKPVQYGVNIICKYFDLAETVFNKKTYFGQLSNLIFLLGRFGGSTMSFNCFSSTSIFVISRYPYCNNFIIFLINPT